MLGSGIGECGVLRIGRWEVGGGVVGQRQILNVSKAGAGYLSPRNLTPAFVIVSAA